MVVAQSSGGASGRNNTTARRSRQRQKHSGKRGKWTVLQANITSFANCSKLVQTIDADAYCFQELLRGEPSKDSAAALQKHSVLNPSVFTDAGGLHSGVAVLSTWACGIAMCESSVVRMPPADRFAVASWNAVHLGGVLLASVYLVASQGLSRVNVQLLDDIGAFLLSTGRPFILSGDWQVSPDLLQS